MKVDSIAIVYLIVMFLLAFSFGKALEFVVDRATRVFDKKIDVVDLLRIELNALNFKVDAFGNKLDALKTEVNAISAKLESIEKLTEQTSLVPASEQEDTWHRSEPVQDELITTAPTIEQPTSADSWTRDTGVYAASELPVRSDQVDSVSRAGNGRYSQ